MRSGDKGRGKDGEPLGNFEPGTDIKARVTVLAEGCWGHLTGAAIKEFELGEGREPQVWELGVKEVWKVPKPLDRIIHTIGPWPLKLSAKYGQIGGTWLYPMKDERSGDDLVSIGFVVDLEYADATTSVHDLLQQFKLHPLVKGILEGWRARRLGGQGAARRAVTGRCPSSRCPARCWSATRAGWSTRSRSRACTTASSPASSPPRRSTTRCRPASRWRPTSRPSRIPRSARSSTRSATPASRSRRASSRAVRWSAWRSPPRAGCPRGRLPWHRNDEQPLFIGDTAKQYPKPDGKYTFDKLSSVYISGNATRDDAPNHIRVRRNVPREIAEGWRWMCPAGVYEIPDDAPAGGPVDVTVNYTNCVQCGAITAKGGRLDPARGRRRAAVHDHLKLLRRCAVNGGR